MASKLKGTISKIQEKYGKEVYVEKRDNNYTVISTGSASIDAATGVGGFPLGKVVELMAWEGTGKTTVALHVIAEAQKMGLRCALLDGEHSYDFDYARNLGVKKALDSEEEGENDLLIFNPELVEDAANITCDLAKTGEVQVIVIDSMSSLSTNKEREGDVGDSNMGVKARLVGQFCRKIKGLVDREQVLVIIIGQLREKMTMYGDPNTTDYGNAVKFFADIRIMLSKKLAKEGDVIVGNAVTAKFLKNKVGKPYQECEFQITFGMGIDSIGDIFIKAKEVLPKEIYAVRAGVVKYKEEKYQQEDFQQLVRDNDDFRKELMGYINEYSK